MEVHGLAGRPMTLIVRDELGNIVQIPSSMPLAGAGKQPLTGDRLREQLGRLGGTPFKLGELKNLLEGDVMLPVSELNRLRREAVNQLGMLRAQPKRWTLTEKLEIRNPKSEIDQSLLTSAVTKAELIVLIRNVTQLEAALKCGVTTI